MRMRNSVFFYILSPIVFVIIFFFAIRIDFIFFSSVDTDVGIRSIFIGYMPMLIMYVELLIVSAPVLLVLKRFFRLNIFSYIAIISFVVFIVLTPVIVSMSSHDMKYVKNFVSWSVVIGSIIGVLAYAVVLHLFDRKINRIV